MTEPSGGYTVMHEGLGSEITERDRPSRHGADLGTTLANLAEAGRPHAPDVGEAMCATCAFRPGCMTNQMAATLIHAFNIVIGADPDGFACHHGMVDGQPTRACAGAIMAKAAPWETVKTETAALQDRMAAWDGPDAIRAEFDAWIMEIDPDGLMDDYQRGRAYLKAQIGGRFAGPCNPDPDSSGPGAKTQHEQQLGEPEPVRVGC